MNNEGVFHHAHVVFAYKTFSHMIIEYPRHKDELCNITDTHKANLPGEGKRKCDMPSHEKQVIKLMHVHLQNDYSTTRLEHRQRIMATTNAWTSRWNKSIQMEKLLGDMG